MPEIPSPTFDVILRGYDRQQVHELVESLQAGAIGAAGAIAALDGLETVLRGYDKQQVRSYVEAAAAQLPEPGGQGGPAPGSGVALEPAPAFTVHLRGYNPKQVDDVVAAAAQGRLSSADIRNSTFNVVLRGYDQQEVDAYLARIIAQLQHAGR